MGTQGFFLTSSSLSVKSEVEWISGREGVAWWLGRGKLEEDGVCCTYDMSLRGGGT